MHFNIILPPTMYNIINFVARYFIQGQHICVLSYFSVHEILNLQNSITAYFVIKTIHM
jgi:hypothetical protein